MKIFYFILLQIVLFQQKPVDSHASSSKPCNKKEELAI